MSIRVCMRENFGNGVGDGKRRISHLVGWSEYKHPKAVELYIYYTLVKINLFSYFIYLKIRGSTQWSPMLYI